MGRRPGTAAVNIIMKVAAVIWFFHIFMVNLLMVLTALVNVILLITVDSLSQSSRRHSLKEVPDDAHEIPLGPAVRQYRVYNGNGGMMG